MSHIRIYYSGSVTRPTCEQYIVDNGLHRLISFAYRKDVEKFIRWAKGWGCDNPHIMLDSGAFTAWSRGDVIDREDFVRYALQLQDRGVDIVVINLDKIPGEKGRDPTAKELEDAVHESHENHLYLASKLGLDVVLPVYHQGESVSVLKDILATRAPYICISPRNDLHERLRTRWCNHSFQYIPEVIKVHGLATTGKSMMRSNAWFSVDSASYIMIAAYGRIMWKDGVLSVSADSGDIKDMDRHVDNLSDMETAAIVEDLNKRGFTLQDMREDHEKRALWNMMELHKNPIYPEQYKPMELF